MKRRTEFEKIIGKKLGALTIIRECTKDGDYRRMIEVECECGNKNIFRQNNVPKYIDYISSDLERMDADVWETFPFDEYSFGLATVEHVLYEGNNNFKERIMKVMLYNGYVLARENVEHDSNIYEDWYINAKLKIN